MVRGRFLCYPISIENTPLVVFSVADFGATRSYLHPCLLALLCSSPPKMALPPAEEDPWQDMGIVAMDQFDFPGRENKSRVSKIQKERERRFEEWERLEALKKKEKEDEALRKTKEDEQRKSRSRSRRSHRGLVEFKAGPIELLSAISHRDRIGCGPYLTGRREL